MLIDYATYQRETLSERPIRPPLNNVEIVVAMWIKLILHQFEDITHCICLHVSINQQMEAMSYAFSKW